MPNGPAMLPGAEGGTASMGDKNAREIVGFVLVVALASAGMSLLRRDRPDPPRTTPVALPSDQTLNPRAGWLDLSSDGSLLAYAREGARGEAELITRRMAEDVGRAIPLTEDIAHAALSPDAAELAFVTQGPNARVLVASLRGAPARTVADAAAVGPVRWSPDGAWLYFTMPDSGLGRVRTRGGGDPERVTRVASAGNGEAHWIGDVLPGGGAILYTSTVTTAVDPRVEALSLESGRAATLRSGSAPRYSRSGHLLFMDPVEPVLVAAPFDPDRLELLESPVPVADGIPRRGGWPLFAVSGNGRLVHAVPLGETRVSPVWVDRSGAVEEVAAGWSHPALPIWSSVSLSPDDTRLATSIPDASGVWQLWIRPLGEGRADPLQLTREGSLNYRPDWLPDGRSLTFISDRSGQADLWTVDAEGVGAAARVLDRELVVRNGFYSGDGAWLVFREGEAPVADIYAVRAGSADTIPIVVTEHGERSPTLSPDGRWLAYTSNASGIWQVWVTPFPGRAGLGARQVSIEGGEEPVWANSGREIFYRSLADQLVAVPVFEDPDLRLGEPRVLFSMDRFLGSDGRPQYDVSADDRRFLMLRREEGGAMMLVRIDDFTARLEEGGR